MRYVPGLAWVLVGVTLAGWLLPEASKRPVSVTVNPRLGLARQALCVSVIVPRHADNRILATLVDCPRLFRSWQEQLDGDEAPYQRRHCFAKMPAGRCGVGVALYRLDATQNDGIMVYRADTTACFAGGDVAC